MLQFSSATWHRSGRQAGRQTSHEALRDATSLRVGSTTMYFEVVNMYTRTLSAGTTAILPIFSLVDVEVLQWSTWLDEPQVCAKAIDTQPPHGSTNANILCGAYGRSCMHDVGNAMLLKY
ncbi:unnamed protein product [Phytophthora fragariaefolia]|uniref:Unnamed protein product n=1 Tax=Phytophthora fragariaefolia TaxID=1490495 RepID=A0A9W6XTS7_9STRA|nr:unnamed protein product [Phytophthora fragariaefolia]